jgi:antirestriction protein ArdC
MRQKFDRRAREAGEKPAEPRASLYDEVTNRIICELEGGRIPWVQPWGSARPQPPACHANAVTGRNYSGVNVLILWGALFEHGYASQGWLTFKQARDAGAASARASTALPSSMPTVSPRGREGTRAKAARMPAACRLQAVHRVQLAQCEGLRPGLAPDPEPLPEREIVPVAEEVIAASGVEFRIGGSKAFYAPSADYVQVPPQPAFTSRSISTDGLANCVTPAATRRASTAI